MIVSLAELNLRDGALIYEIARELHWQWTWFSMEDIWKATTYECNGVAVDMETGWDIVFMTQASLLKNFVAH